jgi:hypothetical protein
VARIRGESMVPYATNKLRIATLRISGGRFLTVSRRPPVPLSRIVARTHMYTYAANVWDSSIVQGPFYCPPRAKN